MRLGACPRAKELEAALRSGHWPGAASDELRGHVAGCRLCAETALLTQAFRGDRGRAAGEARLEPAGAIWWRAQLRRRNAALEKIGKPILGAQLFAVAVSLLAAVVLLALQGASWLAGLVDFPRALHLEVLLPASLSTFDGRFWLLVPILAALAVVSGVLACVGSEQK
jgi:hypothetical protein